MLESNLLITASPSIHPEPVFAKPSFIKCCWDLEMGDSKVPFWGGKGKHILNENQISISAM